MLSRLAFRGGSTGLLRCVPQQMVLVAQAATTPATTGKRFTPADPETPKRDLINFPRPTQLPETPPVRLGFIPETWFQAFYSKTGVTGPYVFGITFATFLCSKEYYIFEHEFVTGLALLILVTTVHQKFGMDIKKWLQSEVNKEVAEINSFQEYEKAVLKNKIESAEYGIKANEGSTLIFDVKRENVKLQQEAEYRERMLTAYKEVKRRLDYQIEKQNVERRIAQKNLVDWVVRNVVKSITAEQEKNALKQCISDLNGLAVRA